MSSRLLFVGYVDTSFHAPKVYLKLLLGLTRAAASFLGGFNGFSITSKKSSQLGNLFRAGLEVTFSTQQPPFYPSWPQGVRLGL
jgi:hypothetical protein